MSGFFQHVWPFITTRQWRLMAITMEKSIDLSTKLSINWLCGSVMESFVYNFIKRFHVFLRPWVLFRKKPSWFIFVSRVYFSLKLCPSYQCPLKCLQKCIYIYIYIYISVIRIKILKYRNHVSWSIHKPGLLKFLYITTGEYKTKQILHSFVAIGKGSTCAKVC